MSDRAARQATRQIIESRQALHRLVETERTLLARYGSGRPDAQLAADVEVALAEAGGHAARLEGIAAEFPKSAAKLQQPIAELRQLAELLEQMERAVKRRN